MFGFDYEVSKPGGHNEGWIEFDLNQLHSTFTEPRVEALQLEMYF